MFGTSLAARVVIKRSFTTCLWKGHAHRSNITFHFSISSFNFRCCACTAAVLKRYGLVVQSPPPFQAGNRHFMTTPPPPLWGGTATTLGGRLQGEGGTADLANKTSFLSFSRQGNPLFISILLKVPTNCLPHSPLRLRW